MKTNNRGKVIVIGVGILIVCAVLVGFFLSKEPVPVVSLSIGNGTHVITGLLAVAQEEGFFTEESLDVEITPYGSGILAFNAMREGQHQLSTIAETPIVLNRFSEDRVVVLSTIGNTDDEEKMIARKDSGISSVSDLRGKQVAIHKKNTSPHFFTYLLLLSNGLTLDDIELEVVPVDEIVAALGSGIIDAATLSEPKASEAQALLGSNSVLLEEPGLYSRAYNLVSTDEYVSENPEVIVRVLRALKKAELFVKQNPEKAIKDIAVQFEIDEKVLTEVWSQSRLELSLTQSFLSMLDDQARWAIDEGLVEGESEIPNYLEAMYFEGLETVSPEKITIIR